MVTSLDGRISQLIKEQKLQKFMRKYLVRTLTIVSFASALLVGNFAFAQSNKTSAQPKNIESSAEDPDLKLSIEELKKKYPIDWLKKKYGNYTKYCSDCDGDEVACPNKPRNLVCTFYYDPSRIGDLEDAKKVLLTNFSENEIKSVFVHYHEFYSSKASKRKKDGRIDDIIDVFVAYFANKQSGTLTIFDKRILEFAFSPNVVDEFYIGCMNAQIYLNAEQADCKINPQLRLKEIQAKLHSQESNIKRGFKNLFFSKL